MPNDDVAAPFAAASRPPRPWLATPGLAGLFLFAGLALSPGAISAHGQDALRNSMAGDAAIALRRAQSEAQPYTFKSGDFRLLATPSLGLEYNDNISVSSSNAQDDFILQPFLDLTATYPITRSNLLRVNLGVGYDQYFSHSSYSSLRLASGSELSFDVYVKDIWLNFHDRFGYVRDPGLEAAVANAVQYGGLDNTVGLTTTWDLRDVVLTLGYDHQNYLASSSKYEYLDRSSELLLARVGLQVNPTLTAGVEGTGSFTSYDQPILNDNSGYSAGVYADWRPGSYFRVQPRAGYASYFFDQTSRVLRAVDQDSWYADLTVTHSLSDAISYSLSAGHALRLGIQADSVEDTYVRPSLTWEFVKGWSVNPFVSFEHGNQGSGQRVEEIYDWFAGGITLNHYITRKLSAALSYRYIVRSSDQPNQDYSLNLVGLRLVYSFQ